MSISLRDQWLGNVRGDVLSGLVVALALIPEAIAFSIIAGVDPKVGLYASFSIATIIAFAGGRPGMISAATGAMALVIAGLVKDHGLQYLLAATVLTGVLQILAGVLKLGALMRFVSRSVITVVGVMTMPCPVPTALPPTYKPTRKPLKAGTVATSSAKRPLGARNPGTVSRNL